MKSKNKENSTKGLWGLSAKFAKPKPNKFFENEEEVQARKDQIRASQLKVPRTRLLKSAYRNAFYSNQVFSLKLKDIPAPSHCKYLGIKLFYLKSNLGQVPPNAASIDKIDPNKGYIPENIQVISFLANRMKNDATIEQLVTFAKGVLKAHGS